MNHSKLTTKNIVMVALLAALTTAGSALRIKIPITIAGTSAFHLGNIMCALSGILLGPWLGGLAAGLGSMLFDILFYPMYISECWITFLTKGAYALAVGLVVLPTKGSWSYSRALIATVTGALTYGVLYLSKGLFYDGLLIMNLSWDSAIWPVVDKLPATGFNAAVAIVFSPILAISIRGALKRNHLLP